MLDFYGYIPSYVSGVGSTVMNGSVEDHDILIEIRTDIKHVRTELTECNKKYDRLRRDTDFHDRLLNRMKGASAATSVFLALFGGMLLYLLFK